MKILLVYPYFLNDRIHIEEIRPVPMGLYSIAAVLKQHHYEVEIWDCHQMDGKEKEIGEALKKSRPDVIGLSLLHANRWGGVAIARIAKALIPDVRVVAGGIGATFLWEHLLKHFKEVDFVVLGEGEYTFLDLIRHFETGKDRDRPWRIPGLAFRDGKEVVETGRPAPIRDLDDLPIPATHFTYQHVSSSRGCVYECAFCGSPRFWGKRVRLRSPGRFVEELSLLHEKGVSFFYFSDDTFTTNKRRVIEICRAIIEKKMEITWYAISRVDAVDEDVLYWMRRAGCIQISYGVESGSDRIREKLKKHISRETVKKAFMLTRRYGILPRVYFIYGAPGENRETIQETIALMREIEPLSAIFYILDLFPGTALYEEFKRKARVTDDIWLKKIEGVLYFETDPSLSEKCILEFGETLRGAFYESLPDFVDSLSLVDRQDLYPFHADFCSRLAMTFSHGDYAKQEAIKNSLEVAEGLYRLSLGYFPNHRAFLGWAMLKQKQRDYRGSLAILSRGLQQFPESESLDLCAGINHMNLGDYTSAAAHFSKHPDSSEAASYMEECKRAGFRY